MADATILFCDLVKFSRYSDSRQEEIITDLNAEITHAHYRDLFGIRDCDNIISLPTGDGLALAFLEDSYSGSRWADTVFSLAHRLMQWVCQQEQTSRHIQIRIGIHKGSVSIVSDFNRRRNVCGTTINQCQRVMNAAQPNQVLVSKDVFDRYVGQVPGLHAHPPFSPESPAKFEGPNESPIDPYTVIAKHGVPISVYVMYQESKPKDTEPNDTEPNDTEPKKLIWVKEPPDRLEYVKDKIERTRLIVNRFKKMQAEGRKTDIREQAAFSTFGINKSPIFLNHVRWKDETFYNLRLEQRKLLDELSKNPVVNDEHSKNPIVNLSIMVDPGRNPDASIEKARYDALLAWMEENLNADNIRYVDVECFAGANRLIIGDELCNEGYKSHDRGGYELSLVQYDEESITRAKNEFDTAFEAAFESVGRDKAKVIERLKKRRNAEKSDRDCT